MGAVGAESQAAEASMSDRVFVTWAQIRTRAALIRSALPAGELSVYGVPRGGCAVAPLLGRAVDTPEEADVIVDDLIDSGATRAVFSAKYPGKPFVALFDKTDPAKDADLPWLVFPWEFGDEGGEEGPTDAVVRLLQFLGEDPTRDGLVKTPLRVVKALSDLTSGYKDDPAFILSTSFDVSHDEMVVVRDIPFWSLCEHHVLPFHGLATVGYIPGSKVVGLSKLARLVHCFARRLQVQERMTEQIAEALLDYVDCRGAACLVRASHTCMEMRGVRSTGETVTSCLLGMMREAEARAEFLDLARS